MARPQSNKAPELKTVEVAELGLETQVLLNVGDTLKVVLPANPSTGYGWQVHLTGTALESRGMATTAAEKRVPGAESRQTFDFRGAASGEEQITLNYLRPWEKNVAPAKTFVLDVSVSASRAGTADPAVIPHGTLLGTYVGRLPCADCQGIEQTISFYAIGADRARGYYVSTSKYLGRRTSFVVASTWSQSLDVAPGLTIYKLDSSSSENIQRFQLERDLMIPVNADGTPLQGPFDISLKKMQ